MAEAQGFHPSERFSLREMGAFMRRPDIYQALTDALSPPAEAVLLEDYMMDSGVWTVAAMFDYQIVGYVQLVTRTSIAAEMLAAFDPRTRGLVAKTFVRYVIQQAWITKGLLTIWANIPSDNKPARYMASSIGFQQEGRLRQAITRTPLPYANREASPPGLYDLVVYAIHKPQGN